MTGPDRNKKRPWRSHTEERHHEYGSTQGEMDAVQKRPRTTVGKL